MKSRPLMVWMRSKESREFKYFFASTEKSLKCKNLTDACICQVFLKSVIYKNPSELNWQLTLHGFACLAAMCQ
jgi:hypothetical protein